MLTLFPESMPHWQDSPSTKSHKNKVRLYNNLSQDSDKLLKTDFGVDRDNQLRDAVLSKCSSNYIKRKLLEEGTELTLTRTLEIAMQCERVELHMSVMHISQPENGKETVHRVVKKKRKISKEFTAGSGRPSPYETGKDRQTNN